LRGSLFAAGAVAALSWFALLVITSLVVWISLDH
jgi:hypothetical protein